MSNILALFYMNIECLKRESKNIPRMKVFEHVKHNTRFLKYGKHYNITNTYVTVIWKDIPANQILKKASVYMV